MSDATKIKLAGLVGHAIAFVLVVGLIVYPAGVLFCLILGFHPIAAWGLVSIPLFVVYSRIERR